MENALLYTLNTIPQALGGTFALLAAFVLYRFQTLIELMALDAEESTPMVSLDDAKRMLHKQSANEARFREMIITLHAERCDAKAHPAFQRLRNSPLRRRNIVLYFPPSARLTGGVMRSSGEFTRRPHGGALSAGC